VQPSGARSKGTSSEALRLALGEEPQVLAPDLALALLVNRTAAAYNANPPAYIVYRETTLVRAPSLGRSQEIDRNVVVRNSDDVAVMHDIPDGTQRIGEAFPVIPYFDPFSQFTFSYFANLKRVDITLKRGAPMQFTIPENPNVEAVVPYMSFWNVTYAPDSRPDRLDFTIVPTSPSSSGMYPSDVVEDPATQLPSHVVLKDTQSDMVISLDYSIVDGHWIATHGTFDATEHALFLTFEVQADVTFTDFSFPSSPPPEAAAALPAPSASP
jgi:hypothetical protein